MLILSSAIASTEARHLVRPPALFYSFATFSSCVFSLESSIRFCNVILQSQEYHNREILYANFRFISLRAEKLKFKKN